MHISVVNWKKSFLELLHNPVIKDMQMNKFDINLQAGKLNIFGTCLNWVVSYIAFTKFHSPRPVFHSPGQIFTRIGERASASFPAWLSIELMSSHNNSVMRSAESHCFVIWNVSRKITFVKKGLTITCIIATILQSTFNGSCANAAMAGQWDTYTEQWWLKVMEFSTWA